MNLGRRSIMKAMPAAALLALAEMRGTGATGNGGGPTCRNVGHSCNGNQTCCDGLDCTRTGNGNSKTCRPSAGGGNPCSGDGDCHEDCDCDGGICTPGGGGGPETPECETDDDCAGEQACVEGICTEPDPDTGTPTPVCPPACKRSRNPVRCCINAGIKGCRRIDRANGDTRQCGRTVRRQCRRMFRRAN